MVNKRKNNLSRIYLLSAGFMISILLGEIIVRVFMKESLVLFPRYQTSAEYGNFKIRKNIPNLKYEHTSSEGIWNFAINSKGFRDYRNFEYGKQHDVTRILSVGDSHTLGYEVSQEETFSYLLEKKLIKRSIKAEVINAGVSGFGTAEEIIFIENEGIKFKPDYIVIGFFKNDFDDNLRSDIFYLSNDSLYIKNREYIPGVYIQDVIYKIPFVKWLGENSYLYSFMFNTIWDFFKNSSIEESKEYAINVNKTIKDYPKKLSKKLLERIAFFCKRNEIKLVIVDIPSWEPGNLIGSSLEDIYKNSETRFCDYLIEYDDINRRIEKSKMFRVKGHRHISPTTHNIIAELLKDYIISHNN